MVSHKVKKKKLMFPTKTGPPSLTYNISQMNRKKEKVKVYIKKLNGLSFLFY